MHRPADKALSKYLAVHAEDSAAIGARIDEPFKQVVVIPAYGEDAILDRAIASIPRADDGATLAVIVVNERADSPAAVKAANRATISRLQARYRAQRRLGDGALLCRTAFGALVLLNVTLARGQGVGLARKHGADLAFAAWSAGAIESRWIHCTDADVLLPPDYFCAPHPSASAALHRFRHRATRAASRTHARIYDLWLRMHVLGLHWARSPYGFHTIGSTITVNAGRYAAVRGFPRRNAGEDFYFLNKLAKLGPIVSAHSAPLRIEARVSDRVPFGTGRSMGRIAREGAAGLPRFYDPSVYVYLKCVLEAIEDSCASARFERQSVHRLLSVHGLARAPVDAAMDALGFDAAVGRLLRSCANRQQRLRAAHCWFDAFRTMKFIHHLRDNGIASMDVENALRAGQFLLDQRQQRVQDDIRVVRDAL